LLLLVAGLGYRYGGIEDSEARYRTETIDRGTVIGTVTATGTVNAVVTVEVSPQISGQVAKVLVSPNDPVVRHQPIAVLDSRSLEATLREKQAELEVAETDLDVEIQRSLQIKAKLENETGRRDVLAARSAGEMAKVREAERKLKSKIDLYKKRVVSNGEMQTTRSERDTAAAMLEAAKAEQRIQEAAVRAAKAAVGISEARIANAKAVIKQRKAALQRATVDLEKATLRSPIDGLVVGINVVPGQTVAPRVPTKEAPPPLFTIARDLGDMEVHARIDEADIGRIKQGQQVSFRVDAFPYRSFQGQVVQIRKTPDDVEKVVTYKVIIATKNQEQLLLPGMTALLKITTRQDVNVLRLPNAGLRFKPIADGGQSILEFRKTDADDNADDQAIGTVWVLDEHGNLQPVRVHIGITDGAYTTLRSGALRDGQNVIVGRDTTERDNVFLKLWSKLGSR
jgi:HlyD family secretion protein